MSVSESISFRKIKRRKKMAPGDVAFNIFLYVLFTLFAFIAIYPLIRILAYSFSTLDYQSKSYAMSYYDNRFTATHDGIWFLPHGWTLVNYWRMIRPQSFMHEIDGQIEFFKTSYVQSYGVTVVRTVIGTLTGMFANTMLAYILSRRKFVFKKGLKIFWIFAAYANVGFATLQQRTVIYRYLHLTDSFWVYIIPEMVNIVYVLVMCTYMKNIPASLEEEAQLEGAGYMSIFWKVVNPLCKPVYAAVAFFIAAYHWNAWVDTALFTRFKDEYRTLMFTVYTHGFDAPLENGVAASRSPMPSTVKAAAIVLAILPLIVIYPLLQKYYVDGVTIRGVKE